MKITVEKVVKADLGTVWGAWNTPADIQQWNAASDDWHTPSSTVDLREGGRFSCRMEDTRVEPRKRIEYEMSDGRRVQVEFAQHPDGVAVKETFDAETENSPELQRQGWQAILDNFARHAEKKS
jgi:uncharacterized protein YndB with AHSA1/START domain